MKKSKTLANTLRVGLIQTTLNPNYAWGSEELPRDQMTSYSENHLWHEIKKGFSALKNHSALPNITILPELSIPRGYEKSLHAFAQKTNSVIIGGLDFAVTRSTIRNKAIVIIPNNWPKKGYSRKCTVRYFGKTFFSHMEEDHFKKLGLHGVPDPSMYLFDSVEFGRFGVAICSDFFDIERFVVYRGQIHHMIVISSNRDITSYNFLAEAIGRLVYCNVVICNSGFYGGSFVFSPFQNPILRTIYRHEGKDLFTTQLVELPVSTLDRAQNSSDGKDPEFKSQPPGYNVRLKRNVVRQTLP